MNSGWGFSHTAKLTALLPCVENGICRCHRHGPTMAITGDAQCLAFISRRDIHGWTGHVRVAVPSHGPKSPGPGMLAATRKGTLLQRVKDKVLSEVVWQGSPKPHFDGVIFHN
jgi:hypothetical protein